MTENEQRENKMESDGEGVVRPSIEQVSWMKEEYERMQKLERDRPELFRTQLSTNDIMRSAHEVRRLTELGQHPLRIREQHLAFSLQYPVIFERCCDPSMSLHMLPMLLNGLQVVREDPSKKEAATDEICHVLNKEYAQPVLDKLNRFKNSDDDGKK